MKLVRRTALIALFLITAATGSVAQAQHIATVQTEFGGTQNDEAPAVEGLIAVGELDGPGIELPIRLETAPGHKFSIPALSREGIYFLRNIRLMNGPDFLQSATPSIVTITVSRSEERRVGKECRSGWAPE